MHHGLRFRNVVQTCIDAYRSKFSLRITDVGRHVHTMARKKRKIIVAMVMRGHSGSTGGLQE